MEIPRAPDFTIAPFSRNSLPHDRLDWEFPSEKRIIVVIIFVSHILMRSFSRNIQIIHDHWSIVPIHPCGKTIEKLWILVHAVSPMVRSHACMQLYMRTHLEMHRWANTNHSDAQVCRHMYVCMHSSTHACACKRTSMQYIYAIEIADEQQGDGHKVSSALQCYEHHRQGAAGPPPRAPPTTMWEHWRAKITLWFFRFLLLLLLLSALRPLFGVKSTFS